MTPAARLHVGILLEALAFGFFVLLMAGVPLGHQPTYVTVVDGASEPVAGVQVHLDGNEGRWTQKTDELGIVKYDVTPGKYRVHVTEVQDVKRFEPHEPIDIVVPAEGLSITVRLRRLPRTSATAIQTEIFACAEICTSATLLPVK